MIQTGKVINGYQVEALVSEGGMAVVYRARRRRDKHVVALKVLREQYAADAEFVERFQREAKSAANLSHPNMVQVFESGRTDGVHFIAMEFVEGENLKQYLRRRAPLAPAEAVRIAVQVCDVLEYAHQHGIIHRDIKPQNILIARDGGVKVADFGIARALSAVTITQTGTVLGSVQYLSPEQARGQSVGRAADIYALSVVLYEMMTGQLPFDGDSPIAIALKHIHDAPPRPRTVNPAIPESLEAIILRGMSKDPYHRYRAARELATDLQGTTHHWRDAPAGASLGEEATLIARPSERPQLQSPPPLPAAVSRRTVRPPARAARRARGTLRWIRHSVPAAPLLAVVLLGVLAGGLWSGWQAVTQYFNVAEVQVPKLIGLPVAEAEAAVAQAQLRLAVVGRSHNGRIPQDAVISQDIAPGRRVKVGRAINVVLSLGPEMIAVPDVQGQPLLQARLAIEGARLAVGKITEGFNESVRRGVVVTQDPPPGRPLARGGVVNLVVSQGPEVVEMPLLVGRSLKDARRRIEELGLILRHVEQVSSPDLDPGIVVDQSPPPGTRIRGARDVILTVSVRSGEENAPPQAPIVTTERQTPTPAPSQTAAPASPAAQATPAAPSAAQPQAPSTPQAAPSPAPSAAVPAERRTAVRVVVPEGEPKQRVRIVVIDESGVRTVYDRRHDPGEHVNFVVRSRGYTIIQIYIDNRLIQEVIP